MNWISLDSINQLEDIKTHAEPVLIFKHSTRCPVSSMAKRNIELESVLLPENVPTYFLDLIKFRDLSNQVSAIWKIKHESPQVLLIHNQECIYNSSHNEINVADIVVKIEQVTS